LIQRNNHLCFHFKLFFFLFFCRN